MQVARPWDPPIQVDRQVGLPGVPGASSRPIDPAFGMVEVDGHFCNFDVFCVLPAVWLAPSAVNFRATVISGAAESIVDFRSAADLQVPQRDGSGRAIGMLFSIRGRPCDKFKVEAFADATTRPALALFYVRAWGCDGDVYGDRAGRLPVDLFARPNQQVRFTAQPVPAIGGPFVVLPANPNGGRIAITHIAWTTTVAASLLAIEHRTPPAGPRTPVAQYIALGVIGISLFPSFTQPIFVPPGQEVTGLITGGAVAAHALNVYGFNE